MKTVLRKETNKLLYVCINLLTKFELSVFLKHQCKKTELERKDV